ncbi:MAG: alpha/beta fold hydrolase [Candidatus Eisenbacteria bacterium]
MLAILSAALVTTPLVAQAQTEHLVDNSGSEMIVTTWTGGEAPWGSILLVPGWGGGPSDVLGIAHDLSQNGVEVFVLCPRGWHQSQGEASFTNALEDIGAALRWVRERAVHDVTLVGHSFGGGMALAYAARDPSVHRIVSVAGTDHGQLVRQYMSDPEFAAILEPILKSTAAPDGPIRFDVSATLQELKDGQGVLDLRENAALLADRAILMFGGWEDVNTTVDDYLLPLYRALREAGASDVTFLVYHTDHGFGNVRARLYRDLMEWLARRSTTAEEARGEK